MPVKPKKWIGKIAPGQPTGWRKDMGQSKRIATVVASRNGDLLAAARALRFLSNKSSDPETKRKAANDSKQLFAQHAKLLKRKKQVKKIAK